MAVEAISLVGSFITTNNSQTREQAVFVLPTACIHREGKTSREQRMSGHQPPERKKKKKKTKPILAAQQQEHVSRTYGQALAYLPAATHIWSCPPPIVVPCFVAHMATGRTRWGLSESSCNGWLSRRPARSLNQIRARHAGRSALV
jgi:hypothetical protein